MSRKRKNTCMCCFCDPKPGQRPHPKYGFDLRKVPGVLCMGCNKPIGRRKYRLDTALARFGDMFFYHVKCSSDARRSA